MMTTTTQDRQALVEQILQGSDINLNLTVKEINHVLSILGKYPFDEIAKLVLVIRQQADPQARKILAEIEQRLDPVPTPVDPDL